MSENFHKLLSPRPLPSILLLAAIVAGTVAGRYIPLRQGAALFTAAGLFVVACGLIAAWRRSLLWLFFGLLFFRGWSIIAGALYPPPLPDHLQTWVNGRRYTITGSVDSDPVIKGNRQVFFLKVLELSKPGGNAVKVKGRLRTSVYNAFEKFPFGTVIRFNGAIRPIRNFNNPGSFDYRQYMAFRNVFGHTYTSADRLTVITAKPRPTLRAAVEKMRTKIADAIDRSVKEKSRAGVLKALTVGKRNDIPSEVREAFIRSGTAHLLAISGLHVGIVAAFVFAVFSSIFSFFTVLLWNGWVKKCAALVTILSVLAYGLIAGMSPSTQRAVIMVVVFLLSLVVEREHNLVNTLAVAALIILMIHPASLFSVSFQLSFAAVLFILHGMSAAGPRLAPIHNRFLKTAISFLLVSAFAIAGTMPLTMRYFNQVSFAGLVSNCLLIPIVGFLAVPAGLLGALALEASHCAGAILFKASGYLVALAITIAEKIAAIPPASVRTVTPSLLEMVCCYTALWAAIAIAGRPLKWPGKKNVNQARAQWLLRSPAIMALGCALLLMLADTAYWVNRRLLHDDLRVTFLDVGQGNSAVLELPFGRTILIDGGGFNGASAFDTGKWIIAPFLWRNKILTIDTMIVTHPDTDHLAGLVFIAENFDVGQIWSNGQPRHSSEYRAFTAAAVRNGIAMPGYEKLPKTHTADGIRIDILYPPAGFLDRLSGKARRETNDNSLVARIAMDKISFLFPGDIQRNGERKLVAAAGNRLASTVLLAPHHGSKTSSTKLFLDHVRPRVVVISAGWKNRYGYPDDSVLARYKKIGATVYRTDRDGAVVIKTRGKKLYIDTPCRPEIF